MAKVTRFKDTTEKFAKMMTEISERRFANLYLLMGEESYFIDRLCDALADSILTESERAFNQITLYGKDTDAATVINCCRQMPMGGQYEVIIVKEAQQMRDLEKLSLYTSEPNPTTILIVCHKEKSVDRRSNFYKTVNERGRAFESVRPRDYEIGPWLMSFVESRGLTLDHKAAAMMAEHLGTDVAKISNEIEKLLVSLPEGTTRITDADIEQNIGISKDYNCYELCRAVVTQDVVRSMSIADQLARNPKANPMPVVLTALFSQFRDIFTLNYMRWQSMKRQVPYPSDEEILKIIKINPYFLGELKQVAGMWDSRRVFRILELLRKYDAKSKGVDSGGISDGELLREFLLQLFVQ